MLNKLFDRAMDYFVTGDTIILSDKVSDDATFELLKLADDKYLIHELDALTDCVSVYNTKEFADKLAELEKYYYLSAAVINPPILRSDVDFNRETRFKSKIAMPADFDGKHDEEIVSEICFFVRNYKQSRIYFQTDLEEEEMERFSILSYQYGESGMYCHYWQDEEGLEAAAKKEILPAREKNELKELVYDILRRAAVVAVYASK